MSLFVTLRACTVLACLADMEMEVDGAGRRVLPSPLASGPTAAALRAVHDHGRLEDSADLALALEGARALGCGEVEAAALSRMADVTDPEAFAHELLEAAEYREDAATALASRNPTFAGISQVLRRVSERAHGLSHETICATMPVWCKFYPPAAIFVELVRLVPPATLTAQKVLEALGGRYLGAFFHPKEMADLLRVRARRASWLCIHSARSHTRRPQVITALFEANGWESVLTRALVAVAGATTQFGRAPAALVHGSVITFHRTVSVLLEIEGAAMEKRISKKFSPHLRATLDLDTARLELEVDWNAVDRASRNLYVRVAAFFAHDLAPAAEHHSAHERAYRYAGSKISLSEWSVELRAALSSYSLEAIRVDVATSH